ncbi:MAG: hypothetical protein JWM93_2078, partial [Frankiales bacterium]|nr:hypothetical protein [Frankiales bacterium]
MTRALRGNRAVRLLVASVLLAMLGSYAAPEAHAAVSVVTGQDIGWPMCPQELGGQGKPMPPDTKVGFVIPELNAGLAFVENQCLADHYEWGRERSSLLGGYLFPNFPDAQMRAAASTGRYGTCTTNACVLKNSGYAQAEWD